MFLHLNTTTAYETTPVNHTQCKCELACLHVMNID